MDNESFSFSDTIILCITETCLVMYSFYMFVFVFIIGTHMHTNKYSNTACWVNYCCMYVSDFRTDHLGLVSLSGDSSLEKFDSPFQQLLIFNFSFSDWPTKLLCVLIFITELWFMLEIILSLNNSIFYVPFLLYIFLTIIPW